MGSNTFPQQQSMGQMQMPQMAPMQQQDQQSGFAGMYAPQYGAFSPMAGGMAMSGGMQGYGGGQSVPNYAPQGRLGMAMTPSGQNVYPDMSTMTQQDINAPYDPSSYKLTEGYAAAVANGTEGLYQAAPVAPQMYNQQVPQAVPNYQVPQIQQQPMAGYGGYAQQPMQNNRYGVAQANKAVLY
jgi:hypothetical protein